MELVQEAVVPDPNKSLSTSRTMAAVLSFPLAWIPRSSESLTSWSLVEWVVRKANCSCLIFGPITAFSFCKNIFSNIFEADDRREIGL